MAVNVVLPVALIAPVWVIAVVVATVETNDKVPAPPVMLVTSISSASRTAMFRPVSVRAPNELFVAVRVIAEAPALALMLTAPVAAKVGVVPPLMEPV